jgi:hypothetical protein
MYIDDQAEDPPRCAGAQPRGAATTRRRLGPLIGLLAVAVSCACPTGRKIPIEPPIEHVENQPLATLQDGWYGDHTERVVSLPQGWSHAVIAWFHTTPQGSRLMPYRFFLALEHSNAGHEYGTGLTDAERWAIVEYMKSL